MRRIISAARKQGQRLIWISMAVLFMLATVVHAQETVKSLHTYTFGQTVTFSLALSPGTDTSKATLYISTNDERTRHHEVPIENNQAHYQQDLRSEPFPAFANITYWWEFQDSQDQTQTTHAVTFLYEDNRFRWQTVEQDNVILYWVSGDKDTMLNGLDIARAALMDIQNTLQTPPVGTVRIYIYPSLADLQSALRLTGRNWIGGMAYPDIGVVLMAIPPSPNAILHMNRYIPHELTHKVLYDATQAQGYDNLPTWLVEGLASYFENSPDPTYALALENAAAQGQFMPLESLCYPFPDDHQLAILAYAQSQSLIRYLQSTYGWSRVRLLIDRYADGLSCSAGVRQVLDMELSALDREWRLWLTQKEDTSNGVGHLWQTVLIVLQDLGPWLMLIAIVSLPLMVLWVEQRLVPVKK